MEIEEKLAEFRKSAASRSNENVSKPVIRASLIDTYLFEPVRNLFAKKSKTDDKSADKVIKTERPLKSTTTAQRRPNRTGAMNTSENIIVDEDRLDEEEMKECTKMCYFKLALKFLLWLSLFGIFIKLEFGAVYFVVSLLVLIYLNTNIRKRGRAPDELSAYSVFNPNVERLQGQLTAEQLEKNLIRPF